MTIPELESRYNSLLAACKRPSLYDIIESLEAMGLTPSDLPLEESVWPSRAIPLRRAIENLMCDALMQTDKLRKQEEELPKPSKPKKNRLAESRKSLTEGLAAIAAKNDQMIAEAEAKWAARDSVPPLAEPENLVTVTETNSDLSASDAPANELAQALVPTPALEQPQPKRTRGRPASGERAMTAAEKQAAYRERQKQKKVTVTFDRDDANELLTYLTGIATDFTYPLDKQLAVRLRDACQAAWVGQLIPSVTSSEDR